MLGFGYTISNLHYSFKYKALKYYLIAGEASGDTYGGLLMNAILDLDSEATFKYWGGPQMNAAADGQIKSISETSFMGFWEVLKNASAIRKLFTIAKESIQVFEPDMLILIDYPGFNLRIMEWAHKLNIKTTFYISPQLWAWKKNRYKKLRDYADLFFVILPFEKAFFDNLNTPSIYYGHPLKDLDDYKENEKSRSVIESGEINSVGIFPGSRLQEIEEHLPILISFTQIYPNIKFIIAGVSHIAQRNYNKYISKSNPNVSIIYDKSKLLMRSVDIAISSSGTATLELALYKTPQIVIYKTSALSFAIGKRLIDLKFISLVNLIANKKVVDELIQDEFTIENLKISFEILKETNHRSFVISEYDEISEKLGDGNVSEQIAEDIYSYLINSMNDE